MNVPASLNGQVHADRKKLHINLDEFAERLLADPNIPLIHQKKKQRNSLKVFLSQLESGNLSLAKKKITQETRGWLARALGADAASYATLPLIEQRNTQYAPTSQTLHDAFPRFFERTSELKGIVCAEYRSKPTTRRGGTHDGFYKTVIQQAVAKGASFALFQPFTHLPERFDHRSSIVVEYVSDIARTVRQTYKEILQGAIDEAKNSSPTTTEDMIRSRVRLYEPGQEQPFASGFQSQFFYSFYPTDKRFDGWDDEIREWVHVRDGEDLFPQVAYDGYNYRAIEQQFSPVIDYFGSYGTLPNEKELRAYCTKEFMKRSRNQLGSWSPHVNAWTVWESSSEKISQLKVR